MSVVQTLSERVREDGNLPLTERLLGPYVLCGSIACKADRKEAADELDRLTEALRQAEQERDRVIEAMAQRTIKILEEPDWVERAERAEAKLAQADASRARLIAALSDLLTATQRVDARAADLLNSRSVTPNDMRAVQLAIDKGLAALAAEGDPPEEPTA